MPKNVNGGNGAKKGKNCRYRVEKKIEYATEGQFYGVCTKYYGSSRGDVTYVGIDSKTGKEEELSALGIVRGSIKKRTRLRAGDIVVVSPRSFQTDKVDIVLKYSTDEVYSLKNCNDLHPKIVSMSDILNSSATDNSSESAVSFDIDDEIDDSIVISGKSKKTRNNTSYKQVYDGMPELSDESEDEIDGI